MTTTRTRLTDALHIFVLAGFALAQPLYDLLGRYPDFFVAHSAKPLTIFGLILILSILVPLLLVLFETGIAFLFGEKFRRIIHLVICWTLAGIFVLPILNRWGVIPDWLVCLIALFAGAAFVLVYLKWKVMRTFLTALSPMILIFPAYFILFTPVHSIAFPGKTTLYSDLDIPDEIPLVLIVFDEFNTMALLNREGAIDSVRYPNFAALARESWWFPNATCASLETVKSIPSILTGLKPDPGKRKPATGAAHPKNLFSLLAGSYYLNVHESETSICPDALKKYTRVVDIPSFATDIGMIYRVIFFPGTISNSAATFNGKWKGFGAPLTQKKDGAISFGILQRKKQINSFITGIRAGRSDQLNFLHLSLPHVPYEFLASGRSYNMPAFFPDGIPSEKSGWVNSPELVEVGYQQYLQQVGYTDLVLGRILNIFKDNGSYDESLVIITADHGVVMKTGVSRRSPSEGNLRELFKVPLLVKMPGQKEGKVCQDLVNGIDILPTIACALKITLPWKPDGKPLKACVSANAGPVLSDQVEIAEYGTIPGGKIRGFPKLGWKDSVFGSGSSFSGLVRRDINRILLGKEIKELDIRSFEQPLVAEIDNIDQFTDIDLNSGYLPVLLRGHLTNYYSREKLALAVAMNGKICATSATSFWGFENAFFNAMLPEEAFIAGRNFLELFRIQKSVNGRVPSLSRIRIANLENVTLRSGKEGKEALVFDDARVIPVTDQPVKGFIDNFLPNEHTVSVTGWAFDTRKGAAIKPILLFSGSGYLASAKTDIPRYDIIPYLKTEKAKFSGFKIEIPRHVLAGNKIRAFGLTGNGEAFELRLTDPAKKSMEKYFQKKF